MQSRIQRDSPFAFTILWYLGDVDAIVAPLTTGAMRPFLKFL